MSEFDYTASAELFISAGRTGGRRPHRGTRLATRVTEEADADTATSTTPSNEEPLTSTEDPGHQDEDAEEQEDRTGSEPSEDNEPIVHGTAPASSLPTDPKENEPQVPEVPPAANDDSPPAELSATGAE